MSILILNVKEEHFLSCLWSLTKTEVVLGLLERSSDWELILTQLNYMWINLIDISIYGGFEGTKNRGRGMPIGTDLWTGVTIGGRKK